MWLTLEQERQLREKKKINIMRLRFDKSIIPELMAKWIAWFTPDMLYQKKKRKNEKRWVTTDNNNGGTQS